MSGGTVATANDPRLPWDQLPGYTAAFQGLARGDAGLDGYLAPIRDLAAAAAARRAAIPDHDRAPLWAEVESMARALGAPPAVGAALAALRRGAPAVVTGQQPGLFGGPIFTWYKTATAIALAQQLTVALGEPVVPVFWMATDDSDFEEIRSARVAAPDLALRSFTLPPIAEPDLMVGHLPARAGGEAVAAARAVLAPGPAAEQALELAGAVWERGRDWGEGFAAQVYAAFGADGLVVVDARADALRALARPLFARYLADPEGYAATVDRAGDALVERGYERQLGPHATAFPLWREQPPYRRRLADLGGATAHTEYVTAARAAARAGERLWSGVALRPLAVDEALPTLVRVLGPAEVAYMAQLAPGYARLGLTPPPAVPRLAATLIPPAARVLARPGAGDPAIELAALVRDPSATLAALDRQALPAPVAAALTELAHAQAAGHARVRAALSALDPNLGQLTDSVAGKAEFQLGRLWEAAVKREKLRREVEAPATRHLAAFLRPDQGLQERQLSVVGAVALAGRDELKRRLLAAAAAHLRALPRGDAGHHLIEVGA